MIPYSPFLLYAIWTSIVIPWTVTYFAIHHLPLPFRQSLLLQAIGYIFSLPLLYILRLFASTIYQTRRANALGARLIPRVKGKWILNLDIMRDWANSSKIEYFGEGFVVGLKERWGETMNTRVLGEDSVSQHDHMIATKFRFHSIPWSVLYVSKILH